MGTIQGSVICPTIRAKEVDIYSPAVSRPSMKATLSRSGFSGFKCVGRRRTSAGILTSPLHIRRLNTIHCTFSSSSNERGRRAENFNENDEDYVNSSITEAVEVKSGSDGFRIKLRDGRYLKCVHNSIQGGYVAENAPHPAIVLKMEDESGLLLPIIVPEMPSILLMATIRNVHIARPTIYQVIKEMIEKMGYAVELVRVTERKDEAYYAKIYLTKIDNEEDCISFDLRPSDAINIAARCKVPIQVNKKLAHDDGMRVVENAVLANLGPASDALLFMELDRPSSQPCIETTEFNLLRNMLDAVGEERYHDAAQWKDKLTQLRSKKKWA